MTNKSKTPQIRFKGFSGEWEEKKIGEVLTEKKRPIVLDDNTAYRLVTVKRRNEGIVLRNVLQGKNILVKTYFELNAGDYLISKRQVIHGANGIVPKDLDKAIVSNEYLVCIGNDEITSEFLTLLSKKPYMYKLFFISSYGVDIEKLVFDVNDWKKRVIVIPSLPEQKKVTDHFQNLDKLIEQKEQKYRKLRQFKTAMLSRMFPQNGATTPEIRFKGFSGEWEEKKLEGICKIAKSGGTPTSTIKEYYDGTIPFLSISDMTSQGKYLHYTTNHISELGLLNSSSWIVPKDSIIYSMYASVGFVAINKIPLATSQAVLNLILQESVNLEFIYYVLINFQKLVATFVTTGTQGNLNAQSVKDFIIQLPSLSEQTKIANYFQKLDTLIDLHAQELEKLRHIKKASLEKMFV